MFGALLKKQLMELTAFIYSGGKSGARRSKGRILLYVVLFAYVGAALGFMMYMMMSMLCEPLCAAGLEWLYFALAGLMALFLGIFGSVFTAKAQLFDAKDNELLLSMPIRPSLLLAVRMLGLYALTFIFQAVVLIPALIVHIGAYGGFGLILPAVILLVLIPLPALAISCLLGWVISLLSGRMKHKSIAVVIFSFVFISAYMYFYVQIQNYLSLLIANAEQVGAFMKAAIYPMYMFGLASAGNIGALAIFALIALLPFAAVYWLLSRCFISTATRRASAAYGKAEVKASKAASPASALFKKELLRLVSSSVYMLNSGIGVVMMIIAAVALIIQRETIYTMLSMPEFASVPAGLAGGAALGFLASMNTFTAPSISLEGKTIWVLKSLPVPVWSVLCAKLKLHLVLTLPPLAVAYAAVCFVLKPDVLTAVMIAAAAAAFVLLGALCGLWLNLRLPSLDWTNETTAVKQSPAVMISLFGDWGIIGISAGICYLTCGSIGEAASAAICALLYIGASAAIIIYLKRNCERIFAAIK